MAKLTFPEGDERNEQNERISEELMAKRRRAAGDSTRMRVMRLMSSDRDWTAKELADALDVGVNGLYYHLRVLEDAQLITAGEGRSVTGGLERTWRSSDLWLVTHEVNEDLVLALQAILEVAKHEVAEGVRRQIRAIEASEHVPFVDAGAPGFVTTALEVQAFNDRVRELQQEFRERGRQLRDMVKPGDPPLVELFFAFALVEKEHRPAS